MSCSHPLSVPDLKVNTSESADPLFNECPANDWKAFCSAPSVHMDRSNVSMPAESHLGKFLKFDGLERIT